MLSGRSHINWEILSHSESTVAFLIAALSGKSVQVGSGFESCRITVSPEKAKCLGRCLYGYYYNHIIIMLLVQISTAGV